MSLKCITIHGHFYQPPRENPWTEAIDRQESAYPFHDWNERIDSECYTPNTYARILDSSKRIINIVNNFEKMSFNFGPTLLSWLEKFVPHTYDRILEADKKSLDLFDGHGSAIAQAYNHAIMPLCNEQDKITQVQWGLADFRYRFQREPESMWLPETAVNDDTLRVLIDHGLKYVILSPYQSSRVRKINTNDWTGAEHGDIDSTQPYRWFDRANPEPNSRFIDIFFYHPDLARSVGFEKLARNANHFADRINGAFKSNGTDKAQLVTIATDGETYGHHEKFAEKGLAYLLHIEAPRRGLQVTNYGKFLADHPPTWEVELKPGENGEGTAWSCAHGLGRWRRNCGCRGDGPAKWTQEWRGPLRDSLDALRDELNRLTAELGKNIFADVYKARNNYIDVILKRSPQSIDSFLTKHQNTALNEQEKLIAIKLMEMQRNALLMYTSCSWFFSELSGIETVQVIQYAARAIQLAEALSSRPFEGRFLKNFRLAKSNIAQYGTGEGIYKKLVKPVIVSFPHVVNTYAIRSLFLDVRDKEKLYHYVISKKDVSVAKDAKTTLMIGLVKAQSGVTEENLVYSFALVKRGVGEGVQCYIKEVNGEMDYFKHRNYLVMSLSHPVADLLEYIKKYWGNKVYGLKNMFAEERQKVIDKMLTGTLNKIGNSYGKLYHEHKNLIHTLSDMGASIPEELSVPTRYTLSKELREEIERLKDETDIEAYRRCLEIFRLALKFSLQLDTSWAAEHLQLLIDSRFDSLKNNFHLKACKEVQDLIDISQQLNLKLQDEQIQNRIFEILKLHIPVLIDKISAGDQTINPNDYNLASIFIQIAHHFRFNITRFKDRLKAIEAPFLNDPDLWP